MVDPHDSSRLSSLLGENRDLRIAVTALFGIVLFLALLVAGMAVSNFWVIEDLEAYKKRCVEVATASRMLDMMSNLSALNERCFQEHKEHFYVLQKVIPDLLVEALGVQEESL